MTYAGWHCDRLNLQDEAQMQEPTAYNVSLSIDALLNQGNDYWNYGNFGQGVSVTYNFPNWHWADDPNSIFALQTFNSTQAAYAEEALQCWADVANITFVGPEAATDNSMIQFRMFDDLIVGGSTYYPYQTATSSGGELGGDVYISTGDPPDAPGTYGFQTLLHEIGHALGLKHPGDYNAGGGSTEGPYLPTDQDCWAYTVMSYNQTPDPTEAGSYYCVTPMLYDIQAIQYVYGPNLNSHTEDDEYFLEPNLMGTIWDTGGIDTIAADAGDNSVTIDLRPGEFSSVNGIRLAAIAFNQPGVSPSQTAIEDAIGSAGPDYIVGNAFDNILTGGDGNDVLEGNWGNDTIRGGAGEDEAIFYGPRSAYTATRNTDGSIEVASGPSASDGTDTAYDVELFKFTDRTDPYTIDELLQPPAQLHFALADFAIGAGGWTTQDQYPRIVADVNGDGMADIVGFGYAGPSVSLATGGGNFTPASLALGNFGFGAGGWTSENQYPRAMADVNGDGLADIVGFGYAGVNVALATGGGHFAPPFLALRNFGFAAGGWGSQDQYPRALADVNGDGIADIVGFGYAGTYVSLATGSGHFGPSFLALGDFGFAAGGWSSQNQYPRALADVNGDGMADIVGFGYAGTFVSLATGGGHFAPGVLVLHDFAYGAGGWSSGDLFPRTLADINGDGKADIVGFGEAGVYVAHGRSDGTFEPAVFSFSDFGTAPTAGRWTSDNTYPRTAADVTGDHGADLVGFGAAGVYIADSASDIDPVITHA